MKDVTLATGLLLTLGLKRCYVHIQINIFGKWTKRLILPEIG